MSSKGPGIENLAPSLGPDGEGVKSLRGGPLMKWQLLLVSSYLGGSDVSIFLHQVPPLCRVVLPQPSKARELPMAFKTVRKQTFLVFKVLILWVISRESWATCLCLCILQLLYLSLGHAEVPRVPSKFDSQLALHKLGPFFFCLFREGFGGVIWMVYCNKKDTRFLWCSLVKEKMLETLLGCCV